mmetsp:Transcript_5207/g.7681  ORF Transcript_5207/g.7681 Transcript_5207/m.7681 type:complete len:90 (-) Transcript_5207:862-1131(-)
MSNTALCPVSVLKNVVKKGWVTADIFSLPPLVEKYRTPPEVAIAPAPNIKKTRTGKKNGRPTTKSPNKMGSATTTATEIGTTGIKRYLA